MGPFRPTPEEARGRPEVGVNKNPPNQAKSATIMKIWTSEHIFNHSWESVTGGQWQKYPNPHNQAVVGTDVLERRVENGVLYSNRIISSDWGLADWVQKLIGANKVCYAHEYSMVNPQDRVMEMRSRNLSFNNFVYMESIIVNTVSNNSNKGKAAMDWIVDKLGQECSALSISSSLDKIKQEILDLKHTVAGSLIQPARQSIEDLQARVQVDLQKLGHSIAQPVMLKAEDISSSKSL